LRRQNHTTIMNFRANPQKLHEHSTNLPQPNNNTSMNPLP